jgi:phosphatidylserine/phosphatidylglycerophosphate/cardiolipin synthase-like enzyme
MPNWLRQRAGHEGGATTEVAMINVILHAKESLRLAFPFVDSASTDILQQLGYAWKRGCTIQILCRDASSLEGLGVGADFVDALRRCRLGAACRVPASAGGIKWTFHAKVLIADDTRAYVGSANLTKASLVDQAEVGLLISDSAVLQELKTWYSSLWSALARNDVC